MQLWTGTFENDAGTWLRWQDASGTLILTAAEGRALQEARADQAENRIKQLSALLRAHGIDPESGE